MIETIKNHQISFDSAIAHVSSLDQIKQIKTEYLGRKGCVPSMMKELREIRPEEKPLAGKYINDFKQHIEALLREKVIELESQSNNGEEDSFDSSLPGKKEKPGSLHPVTQIMDEIITIFFGLGFQVEEGPEIETDYYNFEALNIPSDHPARDMQDTFYITGGSLLRTHTSPVQIHIMESCPPPLRIIAPGKVYRCDSDISHTPMFHQIEGLMVDKNISFSHL